MQELVKLAQQAEDAAEGLHVSERALKEMRTVLLEQAPSSDVGVRIGVASGGCSGLSYQMELSEQRRDDTVLDFGDLRVLLDPVSADVLRGVQLDFRDGLLDRGFHFHNPNATRTCKCGDSFAV